MGICEAVVTDRDSAAEFIIQCVREIGAGFHPDTPFPTHHFNQPCRTGLNLFRVLRIRDAVLPIHETSETDPIKPVSSFASYAQATHLLNLQTLCLKCHKRKTYAK